MKNSCWLAALVLLSGTSAGTQTVGAAGDRLTLSQPARDGASASCRVNVEGRASLEAGEHVWLFVARKNFADLGLVWLQGEAEVDPSTRAFSLPVMLGIPEDIGSSFRISAGVVDDATHNRLRAKFLEMMTTNRHLPVLFPATSGAPKHRMVKKVSHEGC